MNQAEALARYAQFHRLIGPGPLPPFDAGADLALVVVRDLGVDPAPLHDLLTPIEVLTSVAGGFTADAVAPLLAWMEERDKAKAVEPPGTAMAPIRVKRPESNEYDAYQPDRSRPQKEVPEWAKGSTVEIMMLDPVEAERARAARRRRFGKYEILEKIAHGSMGVVYKARQIDLDRVVALKVMTAGSWATEEEVRRFQREARSAARLHHPGIIPIYEAGAQANLYFYSMALVAGRTLKEIMTSPDFRLHAGIRCIIEVCEAIHYAHINKITHRDLKPSNILIDENGRSMIGDFGLAKDVTESGKTGEDSELVGTPKYMAPEQLGGSADPRTDVYALGCILYEMASGGLLPYEAKQTMSMLLAISRDKPVSLSSRGPKISRDLIRLIDAATSREKKDRYQTARALADDLQRFLDGQPLVGPILRGKSSTARIIYREVDRLKKFTRRNWKAILGVAALVGLFAFLWLNERRLREKDRVDAAAARGRKSSPS